MAKGEAKRVEFPEVKAKVFRLVVQSVYTPDVRLAEMSILRKGDQPLRRPGIKWWWFKSGNRGFWDWPKQGPAVMEEEYAEDGARDCQSKEVIDLYVEDGQDRKAPVAGARGPLDHPAFRLHAGRPAHPLLLDRHRLRGRHARLDRHRDPFQASAPSRSCTPPALTSARR